VRIFSITERKVLKKIEYPMETSASIFQSIEKLTAKVAAEATSVLPNKGDVTKAEMENFQSENRPKRNQINLSGGISAWNNPNPIISTLNTQSVVAPSEISNAITLKAEFQRHEVRWRFLSLEAGFLYTLGDRKFAVDLSQKTAAGKMTAMTGTLGAGFRFLLTEKIYTGFSIFGGYFSGRTVVDYSNLESLPKNPETGALDSSQTFTYAAVVAGANLRLGYELNRAVALESSPNKSSSQPSHRKRPQSGHRET
jgi:hypothetical protein